MQLWKSSQLRDTTAAYRKTKPTLSHRRVRTVQRTHKAAKRNTPLQMQKPASTTMISCSISLRRNVGWGRGPVRKLLTTSWHHLDATEAQLQKCPECNQQQTTSLHKPMWASHHPLWRLTGWFPKGLMGNNRNEYIRS